MGHTLTHCALDIVFLQILHMQLYDEIYILLYNFNTMMYLSWVYFGKFFRSQYNLCYNCWIATLSVILLQMLSDWTIPTVCIKGKHCQFLYLKPPGQYSATYIIVNNILQNKVRFFQTLEQSTSKTPNICDLLICQAFASSAIIFNFHRLHSFTYYRIISVN